MEALDNHDFELLDDFYAHVDYEVQRCMKEQKEKTQALMLKLQEEEKRQQTIKAKLKGKYQNLLAIKKKLDEKEKELIAFRDKLEQARLAVLEKEKYVTNEYKKLKMTKEEQ